MALFQVHFLHVFSWELFCSAIISLAGGGGRGGKLNWRVPSRLFLCLNYLYSVKIVALFLLKTMLNPIFSTIIDTR